METRVFKEKISMFSSKISRQIFLNWLGYISLHAEGGIPLRNENVIDLPSTLAFNFECTKRRLAIGRMWTVLVGEQ